MVPASQKCGEVAIDAIFVVHCVTLRHRVKKTHVQGHQAVRQRCISSSSLL